MRPGASESGSDDWVMGTDDEFVSVCLPLGIGMAKLLGGCR